MLHSNRVSSILLNLPNWRNIYDYFATRISHVHVKAAILSDQVPNYLWRNAQRGGKMASVQIISKAAVIFLQLHVKWFFCTLLRRQRFNWHVKLWSSFITLTKSSPLWWNIKRTCTFHILLFRLFKQLIKHASLTSFLSKVYIKYYIIYFRI